MAGKDIAIYVASVIIIIVIFIAITYQAVMFGELRFKFKDPNINNSFYAVIASLVTFIVISLIYLIMMGYMVSHKDNLMKYYKIFSIIYLIIFVVSLLLCFISWVVVIRSSYDNKDNEDLFFRTTISSMMVLLAYILSITIISIFLYLIRDKNFSDSTGEESSSSSSKSKSKSLLLFGDDEKSKKKSEKKEKSPEKDIEIGYKEKSKKKEEPIVKEKGFDITKPPTRKFNLNGLQKVPEENINQNADGIKINYAQLSPKNIQAIKEEKSKK